MGGLALHASGSAGPHRQASKFRFLKQFVAAPEELRERGREIILCGDWNIAHKEIDLQELALQPEELRLPARGARLAHAGVRRARLRRRVPPARTPKPDQYTWWSNRGQAWEKNVGWRIDYQIATPGVAAAARRESIYKAQALLRPRAADIDYDYARWAAAGSRPLSRARAARGAVPRHFFRLHVRDDRRDAHHAPRAARHHQERGHRVRAHLPRLQLQVPLGAGRRQRAAAADRPLRPAAQLAVAGRACW